MNRCERCDRPLADEHQRAMLDACDGPPCSCPAELDLVCYGAAEQACTPIDWRARALAAEADAARLRKLFDAAGQCEHNILALIDHYQSEEHREYRLRIAAEEAARRALVEGLAEAERLRKLVPYRLPTSDKAQAVMDDAMRANRPQPTTRTVLSPRLDEQAIRADERAKVAAERAAMTKLVRLSEEMGLYDDEKGDG